VESKPPPQACLPAFAPDPRPVTKVPNAPVSNSLGLKKLGGGVTCVEDPTGSPPKVATACEANIATAKAISLFKIQRREREASIPKIEQSRSLEAIVTADKQIGPGPSFSKRSRGSRLVSGHTKAC
jgi:hypothetical protein